MSARPASTNSDLKDLLKEGNEKAKEPLQPKFKKDSDMSGL
jgi:hypothetical protein